MRILPRTTICRRVAAALLCVMGLSGCNSAPDDTPELVPVRGKVTLDGQPLEGASVSFQPVDGRRGAGGYTNAEGIFELGYARSVGCPLGEHKVSISTRGEIQDEHGGVVGMRPETIPTQYNGDTTQLVATVTADGPNEFLYELSSTGTVLD